MAEQSKVATSQPEAVQVAVQAQSFQAKAQSLEKAAEAQDLQVGAMPRRTGWGGGCHWIKRKEDY